MRLIALKLLWQEIQVNIECEIFIAKAMGFQPAMNTRSKVPFTKKYECYIKESKVHSTLQTYKNCHRPD